jgi:hypothetical protein
VSCCWTISHRIKKEIEKKITIQQKIWQPAANEVQLQEEEDKGYIDDFDESSAQDALVKEISKTVQDM